MGRFSQWIAGLVERAFCGRRDLYYVPDEDLGRVVVYMEPCDGKCRRRAVRKREKRENERKR